LNFGVAVQIHPIHHQIILMVGHRSLKYFHVEEWRHLIIFAKNHRFLREHMEKSEGKAKAPS